jgi:dATP pyrophosphohydrolase
MNADAAGPRGEHPGATGSRRSKIPRSVLVVIHTPDLQVLLMERTPWPGFWQSVTGSVDREDEPLLETALREVAEETGLDAARHRLADWGVENRFEIMQHWRSRYAPGVTHNLERVFGLTVPAPVPVTLAPEEHRAYVWLPWREAAEKCFSWSNRDAILMLPERVRAAG